MNRIENYSAFERISINMSREFGTIKKGKEEDFAFAMFPIESNLLKVNRRLKTNNGRFAIEAIKICLFKIYGYIIRTEYCFLIDSFLREDYFRYY